MAFSTGSNGGSRGRRRFGASYGALSEINVVPLVDVVLVLLIIFMLTAHVMEFGLQVEVPKVKPVKENVQDLPVVQITKEGTSYLNDKPVNIHELGKQVLAQSRDPQHQAVYVRADETVPFGSWATVVDTLRQAGIQNISVVTQPLSERSQIR